jgi:hypothetical protein
MAYFQQFDVFVSYFKTTVSQKTEIELQQR